MPDPFFKGNRRNQIIIISGASFFIILFTIVLILLFTKDTPKNIITEENYTIQDSGLSITDVYLDEELQSFFRRKIYPFRDPSTRWSKEEVNTYFIPVDEILYEYFKKKNDNYIKEIFSNIE